MMVVYSPLTGVHWPVVESYVSAGRSGAELRRAMGVWNVVWCSATAGAWWAMGPLVKDHPLELIAGLGGVHILSLVILTRFARDPAPHGDGYEPCPPVYERLLAVFRWLLPMSYVVSSALAPSLPRTMAELGVSAAWGTGIAATWQVARVFTFALLQRWQGWHGRWAMPIVGGVLLLTGFGLAVLAPVMASGTPGVVLVVIGLAAFGAGMATIYTAAIYYAMAVGGAQVDAGGTHEALIGVGYSLGPGCGLAAAGLVAGGVARAEAFGPIMLGLVAAIALGVTGLVVRRVFRASRPLGKAPR
jgi:hypothetical protein